MGGGLHQPSHEDLTTLYIRPPAPGDATKLAAKARKADRNEVVGITGGPVTSSLEYGFHAPGEAWVVADKATQEPLLAFGVVACLPGTGTVWLIGADLKSSEAAQVLRHGAEVLEGLQARWPVLLNVVDARNKTHVRWLRRHGFTLHTFTERYGAQGVPVFTFYRTRHV